MIRFEMAIKTENGFARNHYYTIDELATAREEHARQNHNTDIYESAFAFNTPTPTADSKLAGDFYVDIDVDDAATDPSAFRMAADEAIRAVKWIEANLKIKKEMLEIYFSGSKGFHIIVPTYEMRLRWHNELNLIFKHIAMQIKESCAPHLDTAIYDRRRVLRTQNTINSKTGLYKAQMTFEQLVGFSLDDMVKWASEKHTIAIDAKFSFAAFLRLKTIVDKKEWKNTSHENGGNNLTKLYVNKSTVGTMGVDGEVNENIAAIKELDSSYFNSLFATEMRHMTFEAAKTYLKSIVDLNEFLGKYGSFRCIFHDDRNPSATIMKPNAHYESWSYLCKSSNCEYGDQSMDIIAVVMALANCTYKIALRFLADCFGIILPKESGRTIEAMVDANIEALNVISGEEKAYKRKLEPLMDVYSILASEATKTAHMTNTVYYGDDVYFSASARFVTKELGLAATSVDKAHQKLTLLAALGVIQRVADDDLPASIKKRNNQLLRDSYDLYEGRTIQYYLLRQIDNLFQMDTIRKMLIKWIEARGTIKKVSRRLIANVFGELVAAKVYVKQMRHKGQHAVDNVETEIYA